MPHYQYPLNINTLDAHVDFSAHPYQFIPPDGLQAGVDVKPQVWGCSLYAPGGIQDNYQLDWQSDAIAHAANYGGWDINSQVTGAVSEAAKKFGAGSTGFNALVAHTGKTLAPNEVLIFKGARNRSVALAFELVPRSTKEAEQIQGIVNGFKKHSLPEFEGTEGKLSYLQFPEIWNIYVYSPKWGSNESGEDTGVFGATTVPVPSFNKNSTDPGYIGYENMALLDINISYSPDSQSALYFHDGHPVKTMLTLQFSSIRPAFRDKSLG